MSMKFPLAQIMVFAKAPIPGQVKTRLIPCLGAQGAASLYEKLARRIIKNANRAGLCPVKLWCSPSPEHVFFEDCRRQFNVELLGQRGQNLGERMAYAFEETLKNSPYAVIIGTDCPTLTEADLREALTALHDGHDAVLVPAEDGGYVLLGLRRLEHSLFTNMIWGEKDVLNTTRARLQQLQWYWHELPVRWDVDRPEDVERLRKEEAFQKIIW